MKTGDPDGAYYMPAMSDAPLRGYNGRHEWFWEPGDEAHIFPLENLMDMYEKSVGRNSTLILGLTPDDRGLIPTADSLRLAEFGRAIDQTYAHPLKQTAGKGNEYHIALDKPALISRLVIQEDITQGERVRKYVIEGKVSGDWKKLAEGTCIGHKRIERLSTPEKISEIRLVIKESKGDVLIKAFRIF